MGRAAAPLDTVWPDGADPKTLFCVKVQCSASELFGTLFVEPDLQEQLHKQRGDSELAETSWTASRDELPQQLYTWESTSSPNQPSPFLRYRKVRFESPPAALASKPFQNEETQVITELFPEQLYVLEAVSSTSAPYGDKFNVFFRYVIRADGPAASSLHLLFHVEFLPSMNRMLKPMVAKAVDAGVRGTFKIFRTVLGGLKPCTDIKESELPVGPPAVYHHGHAEGEDEEVGAEAAEPGVHPPPHPGPVAPPYPSQPGLLPGSGAAPGLLSVMTQQLVYKEQVVLLADLAGAGLRSVTHSDVGAQVLAALLTVWLISLAVAGLRGWQALCAPAPPAGAEGGGGSGLLTALRFCVCWPLRLVDLPDSTAEVLASLALVAGINWAFIRASQAAVRYLSEANPGMIASLRSGGGAGGAAGEPAAGGSGAASPVSPPPLQPAASPRSEGGVAPPPAAPSPAPASRSASITTGSGTGSGGGAAGKDKGGKDKPGGKDKDKDKGALAVSASGVSVTSLKGNATPSKSKPLRAAPAPKQFSAAQLRQLELGQVSTSSASSTSKKAGAGSGLPAPPVPVAAAATAAATGTAASVAATVEPAPAMAAMSDAWAVDLPAGMVMPSDVPMTTSTLAAAASSLSPTASGPVAAGAQSNGAPSVQVMTGRSGGAGTAAGTASELGLAKAQQEGGAIMPQLPVSRSSGAVPPTASQLAALAAQAPTSTSTANSFANMFTKEGIDSMAESLRSAFRWDAKTVDAAEPTAPAPPGGSLTSPEPSISPRGQPPAAKTKARSDAGGLFANADTVAAAAVAAGRGASRGAAGARSVGGGQLASAGNSGGQHLSTVSAAVSMYSAQSDMPLLGGLGEEDEEAEEPSVVVEEVFENERFQPFRGWGHMWPGHFLPSDRVGHWSDRQGKPGGSASMNFEQVVPHLPRGWRWLEVDWQVDLEGLETEAVDADGWTYALDFYLLKYPPPPQGGKCSLKHFVRRRRYYRTRVRCESSTDGVQSSPDNLSVVDEDEDNEEEKVQASASSAAAKVAATGVRNGTGPEKVLSLADGLSDAPPAAAAAAGLVVPRRSTIGAEVTGRSSAAGSADDDRAGDLELELRPQPTLSSSAPSAAAVLAMSGSPLPHPVRSGAGVTGTSPELPIPRPRSEGAGLAGREHNVEQEQQQRRLQHVSTSPPVRGSGAGGSGASAGASPSQGGSQGTSSSAVTSPVAATLALLGGGSGSGQGAAGGRQRGSAAEDEPELGLSSRSPAVASSPAAESLMSGISGADGSAAPRSGEESVLSPKQVITSHDPLGALAESRHAGTNATSGSSSSSPRSRGVSSSKAAAGLGQMDGRTGATSSQAAAADSFPGAAGESSTRVSSQADDTGTKSAGGGGGTVPSARRVAGALTAALGQRVAGQGAPGQVPGAPVVAADHVEK